MPGSHLQRYRQIAETLGRHGLGFVVAATGLQRWAPQQHGLHQHGSTSSAEHLRLALEELGAVFIKLGQALSTRSDLVPSPYREQLALLQDSAPPVPTEAIIAVIEAELGAAPSEIFASFDPIPLASASLGQAHAATLGDGTEVVLKVRRPGIVEEVELDLEIIANLASKAVRTWDAAADYDVAGIVREFAHTLRAELDYLAEGANAERIRASFISDKGVHIPRVYWDTTTSRVLTLERIRGIKVSDVGALDAAGIDRHSLAARCAKAMAKMIFEDGFFHADPHPGNLLIEPDPVLAGGRIGLVDFGMVGDVSRELRDGLADLLIALSRKDHRKAARALADISAGRTRPDITRLGADLAAVTDLFEDRPLVEVPVGAVVRELTGVARRNRLQLPRELALMLKALAMAEGVGVMLDPEFQLAPVISPYAEALAYERFAPPAVARRLADAGGELFEAATRLPRQLRALEDTLDRGGPELTLRRDDLDRITVHVDSAAQRIVAATIASAFIRGIGEIIASEPAGRTRALRNALVTAGFASAGSLAAYLAWTGRRRRRQ